MTNLTPNLVTTTPSRFPVIQPALLQTMQALEIIDSDAIIDARILKFKELWMKYDPPNAAQYDVDRTEFDPIVIHEELAAFFETLLRDRVNQNTRAVTLAFSRGTDLDAIASRYPYGLPRLDQNGDGIADESDDAYRTRIWLSPSIFSLNGPGQGVFESYVFWALSAPMPLGQLPLKHATAMTTRGTGNVYLTLMSTSPFNETWVRPPIDKTVYTLIPGTNPAPTSQQLDAVYQYITASGTARKGLTDVLNVQPPKVTNTSIDADIYLFPGIDSETLMVDVCNAVTALVKAILWLGSDLTDLSLKGALAQAGVYRVDVKSPKGDVLVDMNGCVNVTSIKLVYKGIGE